ncbi:MAG: hypothetical protein QXX35_06505, partial [Desulfurococcaceae archaeon]
AITSALTEYSTKALTGNRWWLNQITALSYAEVARKSAPHQQLSIMETNNEEFQPTYSPLTSLT